MVDATHRNPYTTHATTARDRRAPTLTTPAVVLGPGLPSVRTPSIVDQGWSIAVPWFEMAVGETPLTESISVEVGRPVPAHANLVGLDVL